ncbi:MAG TPA: NfeD family protein [Thermoanaerobaculia bacterium]|nr:NfeD family protein [Thermoanaerobaculia bacterium]
MSWWIWVLIGLFLLAVEAASTTLHIGIFAMGAFLVSLLVAVGAGGPLWMQLLIFTVSSVVALLFVRPYLVRKLKMNQPSRVDTMVGEEAVVAEDIAVAGIGKAEMRGTTWSARNVGNTPLARGQRCVVERVEGLVLHIRAS